MKFGLKTPKSQASLFVYDVWQKIVDYKVIGSPQTSITFSGLDGDTDIEYKAVLRGVSAVDNNWFFLRFNNDSGANYYEQYLQAQRNFLAPNAGTTVRTMFNLNDDVTNTNEICQATALIYVKSGYARVGLAEAVMGVSGTFVGAVQITGCSWNNAVDNISSMTLIALQAGGIGIGTSFELYRKRGA